MKRFTQRKGLIAGVLTASMSIYLASCGTILHPERRGQPPGRLDPGIVILDAVGLLLFFIPGIIAFAVDFSNGTIYLPPDQSAAPPAGGVDAYRTVRVDPTELTPQRLESVLQEQTGQAVRLEEGSYRAAPLTRIEQFTPSTVADLEASPTPARVIFRGTSR
jgi:hypothetical protein